MSQNFTPINSTLQDWRNLENVNQNNMSTLNSQIGTEVTSFFPIQPSICSSNINFFPQNKFTLVSSTATTATFGFDANTKIILRFPDQPINGYPGFAGFTDAIQTIFATLTNPSNVITLDPNPSNNYVIAQLSMIASDAYKSNPVAAVLLTTTEANPVADNKIALFKLVTDGVGGLTTAVDANCAFVYNTSPEYILSLFPDIQNNPTTGDVTIGGRVANSANNIRTLGVNGTGYAGLSTANASTQLYATEADGTTINTGIVNQYGYRPYSNGTATAILDPANTFAYVSELPIVNNNIRVKKLNISEFGILYLQAVYDGAKWGCSIIGEMGLSDSSPNQIFWENNIDLALFGISNITPGEGMASVRRINTAATPILCKSFVNNSGPIGPLREYLFVQIEFSPPSNQLTGVNAGFAINFTATSVS